MPYRIATILEKIQRFRYGVSLAAYVALLLTLHLFAPSLLAAPPSRPLAQDFVGVTSQLYLLPSEDVPVQLNTHTAVIDISDAGDGSITAAMNAVYQIKNDTDEPVSVPLVVYTGKGEAPAQQPALSLNEQLLTLEYSDTGSLGTEAVIPADSRATLRLSYRVVVTDAALVTVRYAPAILRSWRGPTSTRIQFTAPNYIPRDSWTNTAPEGWSYANADADETAIKWLFDSSVPDEEFIIQFVAPNGWTEIQAARSAVAANGPPAAHLALGDLYLNLSQLRSADNAVSTWFRTQAVAAYETGIQRFSQAPNADVAAMHIRLAELYRNNAAQSGSELFANAALLVDEASAALAILDAADPRRSEIQQWQADGLRVLFESARQNNDWQLASQIVDQMSSLPAGAVDPALLEEGRRIVLTQQALQLMRRGEQAAAAALIGEELATQDVAAPVELRPLFEAWNITATVTSDDVTLDIRAIPAPDRVEEASTQLAALQTNWQSFSEMAASAVTVDQSGATKLDLVVPLTSNFRSLADYVPSSVDYALLREFLLQLEPQITMRDRLFQRETEYRQPMDLRLAGDQWLATAAQLDLLADDVRANAQNADADVQLLAEMKAANYAGAAEAWRDLVDQSWLFFQFQAADVIAANDIPAPSGRVSAWHATAASPPTIFTVQTQATNMGFASLAALALFVLVAALASLLWRLL